MMDRRTFVRHVGVGLFIAPLIARAQPPVKLVRIGFLGPSATPNNVDGLRVGLSDFGYVEGRNMVIEFRSADEHYDRFPALAADLVRLGVDVIVTNGTPATIAAKNATRTIPIVMVNTGDAIATGLVASLARPGGNVTGLTILSPQLMAKRLELVKEILPSARVVAVILNPQNPAQALSLDALTKTAKLLQVGLRVFELRASGELAEAISAMAREQVDALITPNDALINNRVAEVADLAARMRIPVAGNVELGEAGGLIGYGIDTFEIFRRVGSYVRRILSGSKPADIPVEQPTKFKLVVNHKVAKALGITVPQSLLLRADSVIE